MTITITIKEERPWYWPYSSPSRWLEAERENKESDRKKAERNLGMDRIRTWDQVLKLHYQVDS